VLHATAVPKIDAIERKKVSTMIAISPASQSVPFPQISSERAARARTSMQEASYDAELVRRFRDGDDSAFVEIVSRYRRKIMSIALALLRSRADAEEITQDTFVRAHRGLAGFRGDSSLATWLFRIAVNLSRNRYRYFCRRRTTVSLDSTLNDESGRTLGDLVPANSPTPANDAVTDEFTALVDSCMEKLQPQQREILLLRNILSRPYDEIARALGLNVGTVKSRIARARMSLRDLLAQACPEFSRDAEPSEWFECARTSEPVSFACS
jgi:RNA polymerase sigma-70 factor, ECF subfamily